jgi:hypothetical protein
VAEATTSHINDLTVAADFLEANGFMEAAARLRSQVVYVLTGEPYHENSTVLGAFTDRALAADALLEAYKESKGDGYNEFENWGLVAYRGGQKGKELVIFSENVYSMRDRAGEVLEVVPRGAHRPEYRAADPHSFKWWE